MTDPGPTRGGSDLADVVEMLLDKGVVINADIAVSIGDTQLLGVHLRAAIASFETAAQYGLAFPEGTDTERIEEIADMSRRGLAPSSGDDSTSADGARHERRAVALRPSADRPGASAAVEAGTGTDTGGVGGVDADVVDLEAEGEVEVDDEEAADDVTDGGEPTGDESDESVSDDASTDSADESEEDDS